MNTAVIDDQQEGTGRIGPVERVPASPAIRDPYWRAAPVLPLAGEPAVKDRLLPIRQALARPTLPGTMVPRPRLVSQLEPTPACRLALAVAPAGAEEFFKQCSVPAASMTLPPATEPPPYSEIQKMMTLASHYGFEFVAPKG